MERLGVEPLPRAERLGRLEDDGVVLRVRVGVAGRQPLVRHKHQRVVGGEADGRLHGVAAAQDARVARFLVRHQPALLAQLGERHHRQWELEAGHALDRLLDAAPLLGALSLGGRHGEEVALVDATRKDDEH